MNCSRRISNVLEPHVEAAMKRVPAFAECGIKQVYNGAIAYTPDWQSHYRAGLGAA